MKGDKGLGPYLKRLRESNSLTLRQVAQQAGLSSAYLSQIEGGKRGRRKGGERFAPHPQILQKLAGVYHVEAYDLLERAGYYEEERSFYRGFSEERETDRCFDFVIHDPALKEILTLQDKRAVIDCYEGQTGHKLLTWATHPSPMRKKATFQRLRLQEGRLYADRVDMTLTVQEVAEELGITEADVNQLVADEHLVALRPKGDGPLTFSRLHVLGFQAHLQELGLHVAKGFRAADLPKTSAEFANAAKLILGKAVDKARERLRARAKKKSSTQRPGSGGSANL